MKTNESPLHIEPVSGAKLLAVLRMVAGPAAALGLVVALSRGDTSYFTGAIALTFVWATALSLPSQVEVWQDRIVLDYWVGVRWSVPFSELVSIGPAEPPWPFRFTAATAVSNPFKQIELNRGGRLLFSRDVIFSPASVERFADAALRAHAEYRDPSTRATRPWEGWPTR